jgi:translation initiation factor IF-1
MNKIEEKVSSFFTHHHVYKMSVNMKNMKNKRAADERREKKNKRVEMDALDDKDVIFGKVFKALGDGMFRIYVPHQDHKNELIEVTAKAVDKNMARICVNDVVIVVTSGRVYELKGVLSNKNVKTMLKDKRIHPYLVDKSETHVDDEGGFLFEHEEKEEPNEDEEDLNINAI